MRTSSYTIYVDLLDNGDSMLLVHGYTGAYDQVSKRIADFLRAHEAKRPPRPLYGEWQDPPRNSDVPPPTLEESTIDALTERGYITDLSPKEEEEKFKDIAVRLHRRSIRQPPSYLFMPTYQCNLRCSYCFQDHMRTNPAFAHLLRVMTPETVTRIFDAFPALEAEHEIEPSTDMLRSIGFFGGEPLLAMSRSIVEMIINEALLRGRATFYAVSNATELEAYDDLLGPGLLSSLQITLDGPPDEHDQRRIYADGSGSFSKIAGNIDRALERQVHVSVRLNVDRNNIADLPRLATVFYERGWAEHDHFSSYAAAIHANNDKTDKATTFDTWQLNVALQELREEHPQLDAISRPDGAIGAKARQIFADSSNLPEFKESFCGAHTKMYLFDAFADIYACWERTGDKRLRIGNIGPEGELELNETVNSLWKSRTVASNPACSKCRYALHCGGGCAVLAQAKTGRYHANFCDGYASRFRARVAEAYEDHKKGESTTRRAAGAACDV